MTRRPLHKWKSFWLGVLVLIFLAWAWGRSIEHWDGFSFRVYGQTKSVSLAQWAGGACFKIREDPALAPGLHLHTFKIEDEEGFFLERRWFSAEGSGFLVRVPHGFLMIFFAAVWIAWLCRWRRRRRVAGGEEPAGRSGSF